MDVGKAKSPGRTPAREGKKVIAGYFTEEDSRQFKQLGLDEGKTVQALLTEAINLLFKKHGKKPILK
jgi:hypothetical protein